MGDRDILIKAIDIAIENGWRKGYINEEEFDIVARGNGAIQLDNPGCILEDYQSVIFSHSFAKAFWSSISCHHEGEAYRHSPPCKNGQWGWQYHLQQMVLEENHINYLKQFIK